MRFRQYISSYIHLPVHQTARPLRLIWPTAKPPSLRLRGGEGDGEGNKPFNLEAWKVNLVFVHRSANWDEL